MILFMDIFKQSDFVRKTHLRDIQFIALHKEISDKFIFYVQDFTVLGYTLQEQVFLENL